MSETSKRDIDWCHVASDQDLENFWRSRRKLKSPPRPRPTAISGPDLIAELSHWAAYDARFQAAIYAFQELGIIEPSTNKFTPRWLPSIVQVLDKEYDAWLIGVVDELIARGKSEARSFREAAALVGYDATSFAAAEQDIRRLYKRLTPTPLPKV